MEEEKIKRQPCEIYSRCMGYIRPVSAYDIGKKTEFYSRKYYKEQIAANRKFIERYTKKNTP